VTGDGQGPQATRGASGSPSRHVLLYGPPAAGKLTVARALAQEYGLKVLDNHLTADVALRLFDFGTKPFSDLVVDLRVVLAAAAAGAGLDVVSTMVFIGAVDRPRLDRVVRAGMSQGARFSFVQLCPPIEVLERRVTAPSRDSAEKLRNVDGLRRAMARWDCYQLINEGDLAIDNSDNSDIGPDQVAALVAEHAGLPSPAPSPGRP